MQTVVKIAGLVGGTGPESTIDYYKQIIARWREQRPGSYPSLVDTTAVHVRAIVAELAR